MSRATRRILLVLAVLPAALPAQQAYKTPPQAIVDILDAPPLPAASLSPDRRWLLLMEQPSMPSIADLSRPMLRLAGVRIDPGTNGPARPQRITGLVVKAVADGAERRIAVPAGSVIGAVQWSPDGRRVAFTNTRDTGLELWMADVATATARALTGPTLNGAAFAPCEWMPDGSRLLCRFVPEGRGAPPPPPTVPAGPTIQETSGRAAPVRTYQDLLENAHDEALFDYYFTSQLGYVDAATGAVMTVGAPALYDAAEPSPNGEYLFVVRTVRPYSYLVPGNDFPKIVEVWTAAGRPVRELARIPLAETTPVGGVRTGPRSVNWRSTAPATLVWAEALDGGDTRRPAELRDQVVALSAPFTGEPVVLARTRDRYASLRWGEGGIALLTETNRMRRWMRTWLLDTERPGAEPRRVWDRSSEDRYGDPGAPVMRATPGGPVMLQSGEYVYLAGGGATPQGDRPFLDRMSLRTLHTERLWRADSTYFEIPVALLDDQASRLITRRESRTEPPNYFVREVRSGRLRVLTRFADPAPQLAGVTKQLVTYRREDGVQLSGTLYLPAGHRPGTRLPVIMWAYPIEFASADAASQVVATTNRFTFYRGASHLLLLTQGYAVFDDPKMPILGGDTANNHYLEQLAMSARAAVRAVVDLGVADPDRIGVGGHSYGAFMTANLLAHTDLFRAGVARSGAYNRTLTPFGFQSEQRTFWQAPEVYLRMSPFVHADSINEPLLMTHGEADNNSGTFPINSERLYHAVKGLGGTARLVMLPHESHGYAARESVLHVLAEMVEWFDRHVKNAEPRHAVGAN
jgi:dipeptidyl aminopeptidase/acylaminoacyl peptidase